MTDHLLLPGVRLDPSTFSTPYGEYLKSWREKAISDAAAGDVAASQCLQAAFIDLVLWGRVKHDWLGIMDEHLIFEGNPLAYSEAYGTRLHGFANQYRQSTIHAIHTRWWIECLHESEVDHARFADLISKKEQTDGLFYDLDVSATTLRHRMKSELTMSAAMSAQILRAAGKIVDDSALPYATSLTDQKKCPSLGYMGMEYFRLEALRLFGHETLFPVGIGDHIVSCADNLGYGWCDFAVHSKVDAYMGTAKRTGRDKPIHSPLTARHVAALTSKVESVELAGRIRDRYRDYANHLASNPMDVPAFQMRDVPIPFGADRTPIEIICASSIIREIRPA